MTADDHKLPLLTLLRSLDHKSADLLLYLPFTTFRALYPAFLILAYGHYYFKRLLAVQTPVLISRHGCTSCVALPGLRLFIKDYSEL
jgi:hypothetical protein